MSIFGMYQKTKMLTLLTLAVLASCRSGKVDETYDFLKSKAKIEYKKADNSYEVYQKPFRTIANSKMADLTTEELTQLFEKFSEDREEIGSFVVMNAIVSQLGNTKTPESAKQLLKIYDNHRSFFDGEATYTLLCNFKNLDQLMLRELRKMEPKGRCFSKSGYGHHHT